MGLNDKGKGVGCVTCVTVWPYGASMQGADGKEAKKCTLCSENLIGERKCVRHCINQAIVFEDRG